MNEARFRFSLPPVCFVYAETGFFFRATLSRIFFVGGNFSMTPVLLCSLRGPARGPVGSLRYVCCEELCSGYEP